MDLHPGEGLTELASILMLDNALPIILRCLACFLFGSIPFAILAMMGTGIDIRRVGSGNPGFNNVLRVSKSRAILTLIGDMGKGYLAVWLARQGADTIALGWLFGFATVLGHCLSPFLKFKGGKGIATSGGVMLVLYPTWAVLCLAAFAALRVTGSRLKWNEAGMIASMSSWVLFTFVMLLKFGRPNATYAALMTLFLAWRHKKNFLNLAKLTVSSREPRVQMKL